MSIRRHLAILVFTCSLGGVSLALVVSHLERAVDAEQERVGRDSLALKDLRTISVGVDRFLVASDLFFGSGETYLVDGLAIQAEQLQEAIAAVQNEPLFALEAARIDIISGSVDDIRARAKRWALARQTRSPPTYGQMLDAFDATARELVEASRHSLLP